jgi:ankyrin repeat protein
MALGICFLSRIDYGRLKKESTMACEEFFSASSLCDLAKFASSSSRLLAKNAQTDEPSGPEKETPLLLAARLGHIDIIEIILADVKNQARDNKNALLQAKDAKGRTAIEMLCMRLDVEAYANKHKNSRTAKIFETINH